MKQNKRGSIRWRIVLIYFMLVFIAMTIVSVFLLESIKDYQISSLKENITKTVSESNLISSLGNYDELTGHGDEISESFNASWTIGFSEEISVVDRELNVIASTNPTLVGRSARAAFDTDLIVSSLANLTDGESDSDSGGIQVKNLCYVIRNAQGEATGVVYVRADLTSINSFLGRSRLIFVEAIALALLVTVVLGFILARSITVPINDMTKTVAGMSQGDFSTPVEVKSDDEIGQLAEGFNIMRDKLNLTLSEIVNEKSKQETILQYMGDGLIATDLDGRLIHMNPAAREMLGVPLGADLEQLSYDGVLGHIDTAVSLEHIRENSLKEGGFADSFRFDSSIYAVRYDRFKDEDGEDIGIIVILQDITERQKLEDMQTEFVANVSHELKTPLTNIKSYTETLLDGALADEETARSFLGVVDAESDRMNRLVRDLLQLSRLDHRKDALNLKETNIVALLDAAVTKMAITARQKDQQLNTLYDKDANIRCSVDRDSFEQVILNVLSNAIKYTEIGGRIDVDAVVSGGNARISVKDTGIGIPQEALPRIFERFYRVDKARSRAMGGTGLGLAISKQIVEQHAGSIEAESREGEGTRIIITLPLASRRGVRNID